MEGYQLIPLFAISLGILILFAWALYKAYQTILSLKKQLFTKDIMLKQTAEKLAQKNKDVEKHIELNTELEQFVAIAAHDIKSPLKTIGGFTNILKRRFYGMADENAQSYFDMIEQSTKRLGLLTDDLLQFSKADTQGLNIERVLLSEVLQEVEEDLDFCISQSQGQVILSNCHIRLYADRIKLKQVLQNLICNAFKFSAAGRAPIVEIQAWENARHICISVKDNGIGIKEEHFERVFEKFARINTKKEVKGTGLGLSICEKYIKKHKGNIQIERNHDYGVTFTFSISKSLCEAQCIASPVKVRKARMRVA